MILLNERKSMKPLVSIITPSYNSSNYLDTFFVSIMNQDYSNYEIIFINDGSTDDTKSKALMYKKKFENAGKRFVYLEQANGGQAKAMNLGFPYIEGKYFIWPDSDDELYPNNISEKVDYMESHPNIALVMSKADYTDEEGNILNCLERHQKKHDDFFSDLLISQNVVFCPGIYMVRVSSFFKWVPDGKIFESRIGQNYQILLPIVYNEKWGYINKSLYRYILHQNSHSNKGKNNYNAQISRFYNHQNTLNILINMICNEEDIEKYNKIIYSHFNKLYLRIAYKFGYSDDVKKYYKLLLDSKSNDFKDNIYYLTRGIKKRM